MLDHADSPTDPQVTPDLAALRIALAQSAATRREAVPAPLTVVGPMTLARGRLHEVTGPSRRVLAALAVGAAQAEGPVLWLRPAWRSERLCPQGLLPMADPAALILADCPRAEDVPWAAEEALRSGAVALVVAELAEAPDLRQVRRLHLAAAEGLARSAAAGAARAALGLALMSEVVESRIAGIETRWRLAPLPPERASAPAAEGRTVWRLDRLRARGKPDAAWRLEGPPGTPSVAPLTPEAYE
jgi:protein ImuA